jgi:MHS family proline/betaine transporter-like MFS transporter
VPSNQPPRPGGERAPEPLDAPTHPLSRAALIATGGLLGEFYDWLVFGFLAATFATVFFATESTFLSLVAFWSTFAVSMLMRPFGGAFFGWFGTRHGRRAALLTSVGLMAIPMFATAALPGYAAIGLAAPLLLVALRLVQGFSVGGEFSGSSVYLVEQARSERRGTVASASSLAAGAGSVLGSGVPTLLALALSDEQMTD